MQAGGLQTFKNGICLEYLLLNPRMLPADGGQILENQFSGFGFASTALAADDDALVLAISLHVIVGVVADCEYMRW